MEKFTIKKSIRINASKASVWRVLTAPDLFTQWASEFSPGTQVKTQWRVGGSFIATDQTGSGLKGRVIEFRPNELVTVEYDSVLTAGKADPEPADAAGWAGCQESYAIIEKNGAITLSISADVPTKELFSSFNKIWDKASLKIKELAESNA